ncbi:MAG: uL15 family ribosomal protein [Clostridia bacterium]|nr:uL15 family ribosomal protein [Clostridia bacterium]
MTKRISRITGYIALILALLMTCTVFLLSAFAATPEEIKAENEALLVEKYNALNDKSAENINSEVGRRVNMLLSQYQLKYNSLDDNALSQESTAEIINLYYEQGTAINDIAWIYYTHLDSLDTEGQAAVTAKFEELKKEIDEATNANVLAEKKDALFGNGGLCARMQVSIYSEKLDDLLIATDSEAVKAKVDVAKKKLESCSDSSLNSTEYEKILNDTKTAVEIQRNQDLALAELDEVFAILYGAEDFSANPFYIAAKSNIDADDTKTIEAMNSYLLEAVENAMDALAADGGKYEKAYYDALKAQGGSAVTAAGNTSIADLDSILEKYAEDLYHAQAKDDILDYINTKDCKDDARMDELEAEYNADNGKIDQAKSTTEVDFEVEKAHKRTDLYEQYVDTVEAIKAQDPDADVSRIDTVYDRYDNSISGAADEAALENEYNVGMAELEIEEFKALYDEILHTDVKDVTADDIADIETAIKHLNGMNEVAKDDEDFFGNNSNKLANLYKTALKDKIDKILNGNDELYSTYAEQLKQKIDGLSAENIDSIISDADAVIAKADAINEVLDRYFEIVADADYAKFTDAEKKAIEKTVTDACDDIVATAADPADIAENAIVNVNRQQAIACIEAKARENADAALSAEVKSAIDKIKADAISAVNAATDAAEIQNIADDAIFDIEKEFKLQLALDSAEELRKNMADSSPYIKDALIEKLNNLIDEYKQKIRDVSDKDKLMPVLNEYADKEAEISNEWRTKSRAIDDLIGENKAAEKEIDGMTGLSAEEKATYKNALKEIYDKACDDIDKATTAEVEAIRSEALDDIAFIESKAKANDEINKKYAEALAAIEALGYLNATEKQALKDQATDAHNTAKDALKNATDASDVNGAKSDADGALNTVTSNGASKNDTAKDSQLAEAEKKLEDKHKETVDAIDSTTYLSEGEKQALKADADKALEDAKQELEAAKGTEDINKAVSDAETEFSKQQTDSAAQNSSAKQNQNTVASSELENKKQEIYDAVDQMGYLDSDEKKEIKDKVDSIFDEALADLTIAESTADIDKAKSDALDALDGVSEKAQADNLENAKAQAIAELEASKNEIDAVIDGFKYLDEEQKQALKDELYAEFVAAEQRISSADSARAVEVMLTSVLDGFKTRSSQARLQEDEACVDKLTPVMTCLGVIGLIEAVALVMMVRKKNSMAMAAFIPFGMTHVAIKMQPVTAWSLTWVMAAADVIMAIFIAYLAVQLFRQRVLAVEGEYDAQTLDDEFFRNDSEPVAQTLPEPEEQPMLEEAEPEEVIEPEPEEVAIVMEEPLTEVTRKSRKVRRPKVRMAIINVDVLDASFAAGDTVTLQALKEKGLVPKNARCVKVLARGTVTKPLTVVARKFSAPAQRMILAADGVVIIDDSFYD